MSGDRRGTSPFLLAIGAVLVVLGEVPRVVEPEKLSWTGPIEGLLRSGAIGGALVLASVGHLACTAFLTARQQGRGVVVYRLMTFALPLWALQLAVLIAATTSRWVDTLASGAPITGGGWVSVLTFRWNFWVADHMLEVPLEIVGLTLFSIVVQLVALLALVITVVPPRWGTGIVAASAGVSAIGVAALRLRAVDFQDPYLLSLDTFARSDAFLVGVLVACLAHTGWRLGPSWSSAALLVLVGTVIASGFVSTDQYLAVQLPLVALLAGIMLLDDGSEPGDWLLQPVFGSRGVEVLAASWSALVALAPLAGSVIGRRTEMHWILRVIILLIALAIVVRVSRSVAGRVRLPEQPISLAGWGDHWRRVVAEADADIRSGQRAHRASAPEDDDGGARGA